MALFDLNSRYTKSMENGGSYEREASIGGYNRKELRGLNRQARRGTLTQRERARLKYLTDERGGRRKRGLLSGLGGAAATLGALAAAGKLGGGDGEGGSALMDAIKSRLAGAQEKSRLKKFRKEGSKELQDMFKKEAMSGDIPASGEYDPIGLQDIPLESEEDILRITDELDRNVDFKRAGSQRGRDGNEQRAADIANQADFPSYINPIYQDFSGELSEELGEGDLFRISEAGAPAQDFSGELSEDVGEGTLSSLRDNYNMMMADEAKKEEEERQLTRLFGLNPEMPEGPVARRGMSPMSPGPETTDLPQRLMRLARASSEMEPAVLPQLGSDRYDQPFGAEGEKPTGRSKPSDIDPEGLASSPAMAKQVLAQLNRRREQIGLKPVEILSEEVLQETDIVDNHLQRKKQGSGAGIPRGPVAPQPQGPRALVDQILNRYN